MFNKLDDLKKAKDEFQKAMQTEGKTAIKAAMDDLFAAFPQVAAIRWTQYTDYFNDGDPCVFHVHDPSVRLASHLAPAKGACTSCQTQNEPDAKFCKKCSHKFDEDEDERGSYLDEYEVKDAAVKSALGDLGSKMSKLSEAFQLVFGDHTQVTVERGGEIEVEEHEHD